MIAVIADDLSGAAEIAGAAANCGLRAEVQTKFDPTSEANVIVVNTETRAKPPAEAARAVSAIAGKVWAAKPAWLYQKTDSVMRGNVRAETEAVCAVTGHARTLYLPANPSRQRIIRQGVYFVNGTPLHETAFARDPEHPRWSAQVDELLGLKRDESTLLVPDVESLEDVAAQALRVDAGILPAGGVDFFQALLRAKVKCPPLKPAIVKLPATGARLFICGSAAAWDNGRAGDCARHGVAVLPMAAEVFAGVPNAGALENWSLEVAAALVEQGRVMMAIGRSSAQKSPHAPEELIHRLIEAAVQAVAAQPVAEIFLEGGATAAALLKRMGWTRLRALPADFIGTAVLQPVNGPLLLVKPGSYPWPEAIWA